MYNSLRLMLVLALAPMLAMAQAKDSAPCSDVTVDLSGLHVLKDLNMGNLAELKQLAVMENLSDLADLKDLAEMKHLVIVDQNGDYTTEAAAFDAEKRKTIDKSFKVSSKDALSITNEWGKVHVNSWDKNEIKVHVEIIARASSDSRAQELINNVQVVESREGNTYGFMTKRSAVRPSRSQSLEINYTVYMPAANKLSVQNTFGDVYIASLKGQVDVSVKHGTLKCDKLTNPNNRLKLTYGSGICESITGGSIDAAYADFKVEDAKDLKVTASYGDFRLGRLNEGIQMDFKHGSFRIDSISKNLRSLALDSNYSSVYLNFEDDTNFNFDVNVKFGNFNVDKSLVTITSLEKDYTSAEYKGRFGSASPKGVVSITSKYGDVKFTK